MSKRPTVVDLFCGCGGFSLGFLNAGFEIVAAVDFNISALATYWTNLCDESTKFVGEIPKEKIKDFSKFNGYRSKTNGDDWIPPVRSLFLADITTLSGYDILETAGVDHVDVVCGGPPCQSFSSANTCKKDNDFRDYLVFEFGRLILEINPGTFIMENVPPFAKAKLPDGRNIVETFKKMVNNRDWEEYYKIQDMYPSEVWIKQVSIMEKQSTIQSKLFV